MLRQDRSLVEGDCLERHRDFYVRCDSLPIMPADLVPGCNPTSLWRTPQLVNRGIDNADDVVERTAEELAGLVDPIVV